MKKTDYKEIKLEKGTIFEYSFGEVKLLVYRTNDFIDDEAIMLVKNNKTVVIESPCFNDNIAELEQFIKDTGTQVEGVVLAYHMGGGTFLPNVKKYATKKANTYGTVGGGKALVENFTKAFGNIFDSSIHSVTNIIAGETLKIADTELSIVETADAFDIVFPEINVIYTHMLGHDCHSIIGGAAHADTMIAELEGYINKNYDLILTSHYDPEDTNDVKTKIDYVKNIKSIANKSANAEKFKEKVKSEYPNYSGLNYLDITAGAFFPA